jgi:hypothetical protein
MKHRPSLAAVAKHQTQIFPMTKMKKLQMSLIKKREKAKIQTGHNSRSKRKSQRLFSPKIQSKLKR